LSFSTLYCLWFGLWQSAWLSKRSIQDFHLSKSPPTKVIFKVVEKVVEEQSGTTAAPEDTQDSVICKDLNRENRAILLERPQAA